MRAGCTAWVLPAAAGSLLQRVDSLRRLGLRPVVRPLGSFSGVRSMLAPFPAGRHTQTYVRIRISAFAAAALWQREQHALARAGVDAVVRLGDPVEGQRVADGYGQRAVARGR